MMHVNAPVNRPVSGKNGNPHFGSASAPLVLKALDFANLGVSTIEQNKLIYGMVIGSRIGYSRSPNERNENIRRDVLGWYSWFMGSPLLQVGMALGLLPLVSKGSRELMVSRLNESASFPKKIFYTLLDPSKLWLLASDTTLHQRKAQVVKDLHSRGMSGLAAKADKLFARTIVWRGMLSFVGLVFTIAMLGVGINLINIALTRSALRKKQAASSEVEGSQIPPELIRALVHQQSQKQGARVAMSGYAGANPFYQQHYQALMPKTFLGEH